MNPNNPLTYESLTQVTKAVIKTTPAVLRSLYFTNANAAQRFLQIFDKATTPAGGDVPKYSFPVPAGSATAAGTIVLDEVFFTRNGITFHTGLGWAVSTTLGTFTDSATNTDHVMIANYI